ncbi:MAG: SCP2 sterol-binding domain-containing protein [Mariprofundaceae bacterium]
MSIMFLPLRLIPVSVQAVVLSTVLSIFFSRDKSLDPLLYELDGRVFHIHVKDMNSDFYLGFRQGKAWVHSEHKGKADVRIDATTSGFSRLCFAHEDPDDLVFHQVLKLSGDSEAMLRFKKLIAAADIDWERELRAAFGEYFGSRVAEAATALLKAESKLSEASHQGIRSCMQNMDVPDQKRLQEWQAGVEQASRDATRLKRRLTLLEKKMNPE